MEVYAVTRNVPMSAQKMREVVRQIQGLPAVQARQLLSFIPRKGARYAELTLRSALANAEELARQGKFDRVPPERWRVRLAVAETGVTYKRWIPKARGSAGPIRKRHCHVRIVLSTED
ncbi:large ribosomal subunit protein uL22 [Limisphaera sp. 4302-co]|uniref:large ribosomal subunit protein uL22 n=1 Tax=Limisphaera sp. 4302-co TaxID=3400417 RepID=UPI003C276ADA